MRDRIESFPKIHVNVIFANYNSFSVKGLVVVEPITLAENQIDVM